jgi:hypothetical protein
VGSRADLGVLDDRNIPCTLPKIIIEKLIFFHEQIYIITRVKTVSTVNTSSSSSQSFIYFRSKYLSKDLFKLATILVSGDCRIPSSNFAPQPFKFPVIGNYKAENKRVGSTGKASDTCLATIGLNIGWDTGCRDTDFSWVFLSHSRQMPEE